VLHDWNYSLSGLSGSVYVKGRAALYVSTTLSISQLVIETNQSLDLYCAAGSASIAVGPQPRTPGFRFWGLPSCRLVRFDQPGQFAGMVYAPSAEVHFSNSDAQTLEFSGALVARAVFFFGNVNFHFDESLIGTGPFVY
jgi:hypothetical protein